MENTKLQTPRGITIWDAFDLRMLFHIQESLASVKAAAESWTWNIIFSSTDWWSRRLFAVFLSLSTVLLFVRNAAWYGWTMQTNRRKTHGRRRFLDSGQSHTAGSPPFSATAYTNASDLAQARPKRRAAAEDVSLCLSLLSAETAHNHVLSWQPVTVLPIVVYSEPGPSPALT